MTEPARTEEARRGIEQEQSAEQEKAKNSPSALAPEDFYYENGLLVFTAAYHVKRGYCCNSGCRHCPFR